MSNSDHSRDYAHTSAGNNMDDALDDLYDLYDSHDAHDTQDTGQPARRPVIAVCPEHLERALEEYVDDYLRAPDVYLADDPDLVIATGGRPAPPDCQFCRARAKYVVI